MPFFCISFPSTNSSWGEIRNIVFPAQLPFNTVSSCALFFFRSCNTPWPLEAPLIHSLTFDLPPSPPFCFPRSGHRQARDMPRGSSHLRGQRGAALSQTRDAGRWDGDGSGNGGRAGLPPTDGPGPHRPVLPPPRPADWGAACGDRPGAAAAPPQPSHRQRSVTETLSLLLK